MEHHFLQQMKSDTEIMFLLKKLNTCETKQGGIIILVESLAQKIFPNPSADYYRHFTHFCLVMEDKL